MIVRRIVSRLGLVLLGTLLALALIEVALRVVSPLLAGLRGGANDADFTVLCVGDSHTYGLHLPAPFSYPAQLQGKLDPEGRTIGVLNYGVPGRNSAALLRELPRYLEENVPDVVCILVGYNDSWNFDGETASGRDDASSIGRAASALRTVRLVRLLRLRARGREVAAPEVIERDGRVIIVDGGHERPAALGGTAFGVVDGDALRRKVAANLAAMIRLVREAHATPVLLTYETENQPVFVDLNENVRAVAAEHEVPLVDTATPMRERIAAMGYAELFFDDDHPRAHGNELIAAEVARRLVALELVPAVEPAAARDVARTTRLELVAKEEDGFVLRVVGAPRRDVQVVLSPHEGAFDVIGTTIPLGADPLIAHSMESQNLRTRTNQDGEAMVRVTRTFLGEHAAKQLYCVAAVFPLGVLEGAKPSVSNRVMLTP